MSDSTTVQVRIPEPLLRYGYQVEDIQQRVIEWLVLSLFSEGRVSSGKAASLLGITRATFLGLLRQRGIAYLDLAPDELEAEFRAADALGADTTA
jgi:predicted HTH domain antitoxin